MSKTRNRAEILRELEKRAEQGDVTALALAYLINELSGERGGYDRPRTMYKVTCSDCGEETEVPFKPTKGRPVYCRECYPKHKRRRERTVRPRARV